MRRSACNRRGPRAGAGRPRGHPECFCRAPKGESTGGETDQGNSRTVGRLRLIGVVLTAFGLVGGCDHGPWTQKQLAIKDEQGMTLLHRAARDGRVTKTKALLAAGAKLETRDPFDRTALHWASIAGERGVAEVLARAGANLKAKAYYDMTPLHWAALKGRAQVADLLIANGAPLEAKNIYGMTPLHEVSSPEALQVLLRAGAKVGAQDHQGMTPLHWARAEAVARDLIEAGADIRIESRDGRQPIHMTVAESDKPPKVVVHPSNDRVRVRSEQAEIRVTVRSHAEQPIEELQVRADTQAATVTVTPPALAKLNPGQMMAFRLAFERLASTAEGVHPLGVTIAHRQGPEAVRFNLRIDTRRHLTPEDKGYVQLGKVNVRPAPSHFQMLAYLAVPIVLVAMWLWHLRGRKRAAAAVNSDDAAGE